MEDTMIIEVPVADGAVAFMLRCHADSHWWEAPEWAVLTITPQYARALVSLCQEVRRIDVYKIAKFDYSASYYEQDWDEDSGEEWLGEPVRTEIDQMNCFEDGVRWSACIRHTDMTFSTEEIPVQRLCQIVLADADPSQHPHVEATNACA
jgi:hypothetical protein